MRKNKTLLAISIPISVFATVLAPLSSCSKQIDTPIETKYTINFSAFEGVELSSTAPIQVQSGTKWKDVSKPEVYIDDEYADYGWYDTKTLKKLTDETQIDRDISAKFVAYKKSEVHIMISLVIDGEVKNLPFIQGYTFNKFKEFYDIKKPTKLHHIFNGWFVNKIQILDDYEFPIQEELQIEANFTAIKRKITFCETEGVVFVDGFKKEIEVIDETLWKDIEPKVSYSNDYIGYGWYDINTSKKLEPNDKISSAICAKFIAFKSSEVSIKVTVKFDTDNIKQVVFIKGKTFNDLKNIYTDLKEPKKQYHTFNGWFIDNGKTQITDDYVFMDDVEIEAKFLQNKHKITFSVSNGADFIGLQPSPILFNDGITWGKINKPAVEVIDNFVGYGWFDENTGVKLTADTIIADSDISAKYIALPSPMSLNVFIKAGSQTYGPVPFVRGKTFGAFKKIYPKICEPEKEGQNFIGWFVGLNKIDDTYKFPDDKQDVTIDILFDKEDFTTCSWNNIIIHCDRLENKKITEEEFCNSFTNGKTPITKMDDFVGLQRTILINNKKHLVRVNGTNHDTIANTQTKAALTFELVTLLSNSEGNSIKSIWDTGNNYNYTHGYLKANLTGKYPAKLSWKISAYNMLPAELKFGIKEVTKDIWEWDNKGKNGKLIQYNDYVFSLTCTEMNVLSGGISIEGKPYKYWTTHYKTEDDRIKKDANGRPSDYWLASANAKTSDRAWYVYECGQIFSPIGTSIENEYSVSFAFCI